MKVSENSLQLVFDKNKKKVYYVDVTDNDKHVCILIR